MMIEVTQLGGDALSINITWIRYIRGKDEGKGCKIYLDKDEWLNVRETREEVLILMEAQL